MEGRMSKSMRMIKIKLASVGIKPTNRNARKELHRWRKLRRMIRAEQKRVDSIIPRYELPYYCIEEESDA